MITNISHLAPIGKSHHHVLHFDLFTKVDIPNQPKRYLYSKGDYENLRKELNLDFTIIDNMNSIKSWEWLHNNLQSATFKHVPKITIKK